MKMNIPMEKLLDKWKILDRIDKIRLEPRLSLLLSSGIVESKGCYLLKSLLPHGFDMERAIQSSIDRTEIECEINHVHVDDYLDRRKVDEKTLVEQSVLYAFSLQALLSKSSEFKIIFACTDEPRLDCNIRFHKQRIGEGWLSDDIEGYKDMILVID